MTTLVSFQGPPESKPTGQATRQENMVHSWSQGDTTTLFHEGFEET